MLTQYTVQAAILNLHFCAAWIRDVLFRFEWASAQQTRGSIRSGWTSVVCRSTVAFVYSTASLTSHSVIDHYIEYKRSITVNTALSYLSSTHTLKTNVKDVFKRNVKDALKTNIREL